MLIQIQCVDGLCRTSPLATSISAQPSSDEKCATRFQRWCALPGDIQSETDTRPQCRRLGDGCSLLAATYPIALPKCCCRARDTYSMCCKAKEGLRQ
jgi:hypothetical protein